MNIRTILAAALTLCAISATAQNIEYETVSATGYLKGYDADMECTVYLTNEVTIKLAKSCQGADANLSGINAVALQAAFGDNYDNFSNQQMILTNVKKYVMSSDFSDFKFKAYGYEPDADNYESNLSNTITAEPVSIYKGVLFYKIVNDEFLGGAHPSSIYKTVGINIATGEETNVSTFFTFAKQKAIMRMLTNSANVKKYIVDASNYDTYSCKEIAQGIKENVMVEDFVFPNFYIKDNRLHILFSPYEVASYAVGAPEFSIPMTVVNNAGSSSSTTKRRTTTRRR